MAAMMTNDEVQQLGRSKNALLFFLERRMSVPKIYLDANWNSVPVDLLAIDRDGIGDVHVVLLYVRKFYDDGMLDIVSEQKDMEDLLRKLSALPAQFKYLGIIDVIHPAPFFRRFPLHMKLFEEFGLAPDGLGRMGLLRIDAPIEEDIKVEIVVKPERFRARIAQLADEYIQQHEADWEIRA
jgi:hypothetical protein